MQYEIPNSVALLIGLNDTQMGFFRKILMEAAFKAGLPLLERADFANFILRLPINSKEAEKLLDVRMQEKPPAFRILWNGKDPSPKDKTLEIQDWEFNKRRGKEFTIVLNDFEKEELKRRQIYYQLNGGTLGSMQEAAAGDTIIVDLNFVYERTQFNEAKAQAAFEKQIAFAEKVYGAIEIKFYKIWTAGAGDWKTRTIKEGKKADYVNIFLSVREQNDALSAIDATEDEKTGEITTYDIFLTKGKFEGGGGLTNYSLREEALAHELGHKFGLFGDPNDTVLGFKNFLGYSARNWVSDAEINNAIRILSYGTVRKGVDWNKLGKGNPVIVSNMRDFWASVSTYDKMRIGARRLSKAQ